MRLDPLTLVAQLVNFALLVVLLWRLLFRPVAAVLRDREERIRSQLQRAEQTRLEAEQQQEAVRREREELERERVRRLQDLDGEIERRRSLLLDQVGEEGERERRRQAERLAEERALATMHLRREGGRLVAAAVARGLEELAGRSLHDAALARFEERLAELPAAQRAALRSGTPPWTLATAWPLDAETRRALLAALARVLGSEAEVGIVHEPELVGGIELRAGDLSLGWSVRHLADDLERRLAPHEPDGRERIEADDDARRDDLEEVG